MNEKLMKIAAALDWTDSEISLETQLDALQWDSMAMMTVIAMARSHGKVVSGSQLNEMKTVGDLLAAI